MNKQVELIKAEIKRLKSQLLRGACASQIAMETRCKDEAYDEMLNFINSLPEEPVSEDLEKAAIEYCSGNKGADARVRTGFLQGAKWQEQQMMEKAVDGKIIARFPLAPEPCYDDVEIYAKYTKGLEEGDKVKVIIIKDE